MPKGKEKIKMAYLKKNDLLTIIHKEGGVTLAICLGLEFRCYFVKDKKNPEKKKKHYSGYGIFEVRNQFSIHECGTLIALPAYLVKKENENLLFDENSQDVPAYFDEDSDTHFQNIIDAWKKKQKK
jgi:hypothetical protein